MPEQGDLYTAISRFVNSLDREPGAAPIGPHDDLTGDAGLDSMTFLRIVVWVEDEFGVTVPDHELTPDRFATITRIVDYVRRHTAGTPGG